MNKTIDKIKKQISENDIIIYIKGTPENPLCGFSAQSIHILNLIDVKYSYVDVIENDDIRKALPNYSNWPTFPQLYYKQQLIGGADIISELYQKNELKKKLTI